MPTQPDLFEFPIPDDVLQKMETELPSSGNQEVGERVDVRQFPPLESGHFGDLLQRIFRYAPIDQEAIPQEVKDIIEVAFPVKKMVLVNDTNFSKEELTKQGMAIGFAMGFAAGASLGNNGVYDPTVFDVALLCGSEVTHRLDGLGAGSVD